MPADNTTTDPRIQVLKTLALTLAVMAKSSNDPALRIAASEEEVDTRRRLRALEVGSPRRQKTPPEIAV